MTLKPAAVFSDHMVLQRDRTVPVWGTAVPGAQVTCRLDPAAVTACCQADGSGCWRAGGVQLAGTDGIFRDARAVPDGPDRILADCGALRHPCAVRYAWYNYGPAGLYGGTGLPAAPFGPQTLND